MYYLKIFVCDERSEVSNQAGTEYTRKLLPCRGETEEGRPRRRRRRLRRTRIFLAISLTERRTVRCERDREPSLSQCRLVNTNKPRSRDKIFDLHSTCTHTRASRMRQARTQTQLAPQIACSSSPLRGLRS